MASKYAALTATLEAAAQRGQDTARLGRHPSVVGEHQPQPGTRVACRRLPRRAVIELSFADIAVLVGPAGGAFGVVQRRGPAPGAGAGPSVGRPWARGSFSR